MSPTRSELSVYGPLKVAVAYLAFTLVIHTVGPWTYANEEALPAYIFMTAAVAMFALGYFSVARRWRGTIQKSERDHERNYRRYRKLAKFSLITQLTLTILAFLSGWNEGSLSFDSLSDPGKLYINALDRQEAQSSTSFIGQLSTLASPIFYLGTIYFIFNFSRTASPWRHCLIATLGLQLLYDVLLKGAQKAFFDIGIMVATATFLSTFFSIERYRALRRMGLILFAALFAIFVFFQLSRLDAYGITDYSGNGVMVLHRDGLLFQLLGDSLGLGVSMFIGYLSQGYYGLSLCLQLPFQWTYGIGNSFALTSYAEQYFGAKGIFEGTYPARMEAAFGWPAKMYWHTFFPWMASDITFIGTILLMFIIGRIFASSMWNGAAKGSTLDVSIFYFMATLIFYLPANNQLMQTRSMMIGFTVLLAVWTAKRLVPSLRLNNRAR